MTERRQMAYEYDGSFAGFLCCVFDSYLYKEEPEVFSAPEQPQLSLYPVREVVTDAQRARRVFASLGEKVSPGAAQMVRRGFCTCLPERERHLLAFIRLAYQHGPGVMAELTDARVDVLRRAVRALDNEVEAYRGFVRFSECGGVLAGEIEPKNRVLPFLRGFFAARLSGEHFALYDRTHGELLLYAPGHWEIVPAESLSLYGPDESEQRTCELWRCFYDRIAIEGRCSEKRRMTHLPKRYRGMMTEFQPGPDGR